jgi:hypothetical protein
MEKRYFLQEADYASYCCNYCNYYKVCSDKIIRLLLMESTIGDVIHAA